MQSTNSSSAQSNVYAPPEARVDDVVPEGELELATPASRFAAQLVDSVLCSAIAIAVGLAAGFSMFTLDHRIGIAPQFAFFALWALSYLLVNGYFLYRDGQTLGKKAMNIRIIRTDGSKAGFVRILLLRTVPVWLVGQIPVLGPLCSLADPFFIIRDSRKCIHDDIADTIVVRV